MYYFYTWKENHIDSAVSKILRYTQADRHKYCRFYIRICIVFFKEYVYDFFSKMAHFQIFVFPQNLYVNRDILETVSHMSGKKNFCYGRFEKTVQATTWSKWQRPFISAFCPFVCTRLCLYFQRYLLIFKTQYKIWTWLPVNGQNYTKLMSLLFFYLIVPFL